MILKTECVVLGSRRFGDSSRIVTLYTLERGRMAVMARGAMQPKSRLASVLQPMSYMSAMIYCKEGRDLQNLSAAESVQRFPRLASDLERLTVGMAIVEILAAVVLDEDPNPALFDGLVESFRSLDDMSLSPQLAHLGFLVSLAFELGYALRTDECGICETPFVPNGVEYGETEHSRWVPYSLSVGAPLCAEHSGESVHLRLSRTAFDLLVSLKTDRALLAIVPPSHAVATELLDTLHAFIRMHVEGMRRLRAGGVASKVLGARIYNPAATD